MGYRNREIEIKLSPILKNGGTVSSLPAVNGWIEGWVERIMPEFEYIIGHATDYYWDTPKHSDGDFVRIRRIGDRGQITLKGTDKKDITNRIEIDLQVDDYKQARTLMGAVHGDPKERVKKKYHVYFLESDDTTISVYRIDKDENVFIEVEARTEKRVKELTTSLSQYMNELDEEVRLMWVKQSVHDVFVEKQKIKHYNIKDFLEG